MNRSSSYLVVFVILMFAYSCKSEVKSPNMETNTTTPKAEVTKTSKGDLPEHNGNTSETRSTIDEKESNSEAGTTKEPSKKQEKEPVINESRNSTTIKSNNDHANVIQAKDIEITQPVITSASAVKTKTKPRVTKPASDVNSKDEKIKEVEQTETTKIDPEVKPEKEPTNPEKIETAVLVPDHKPFDVLLKKYVSPEGVVDYKGLKANVEQLDAYLKSLESYKVDNSWSKNEKLAFWINAYNAYTIKLILNNYGLQSITDLHGGKPWDYKWINLDGRSLSLNNIENDIIRPKFNEPRIHFAVNCAAQSCPPLMNGAFTAKQLNSQLENQTKKFINNKKYNTLSKNEVTISKIFDWYGQDFNNVSAFIAKYANTSVSPQASIKYNEYDWALNGK